jgi:2-polyprenyl-3-methyl-5-hydroxy-6-metoxy-1,4-benzoquinol methylase
MSVIKIEEGVLLMKADLYEMKDYSYFQNIRHDIIKLVADGKNKVLEIGCGNGITLVSLKKLGKADFIAGVDIVDLGQKEILDKFVLGDIEKIEKLPFEEKFFDVIICADVLEHLVDPWKVVKNLKKFLKEDGVFIASIPNIRHYKVLFEVFVKGSFKYVDAGILDKTHLRFFCKKNMIEMFEEAGLKIEEIKSDLDFNGISLKKRIFNFLTFNKFYDFFVTQFIIKVRKL